MVPYYAKASEGLTVGIVTAVRERLDKTHVIGFGPFLSRKKGWRPNKLHTYGRGGRNYSSSSLGGLLALGSGKLATGNFADARLRLASHLASCPFDSYFSKLKFPNRCKDNWEILAGGVGIEPTLLVLETKVLPLNEPPTKVVSRG